MRKSCKELCEEHSVNPITLFNRIVSGVPMENLLATPGHDTVLNGCLVKDDDGKDIVVNGYSWNNLLSRYHARWTLEEIYNQDSDSYHKYFTELAEGHEMRLISACYNPYGYWVGLDTVEYFLDRPSVTYFRKKGMFLKPQPIGLSNFVVETGIIEDLTYYHFYSWGKHAWGKDYSKIKRKPGRVGEDGLHLPMVSVYGPAWSDLVLDDSASIKCTATVTVTFTCNTTLDDVKKLKDELITIGTDTIANSARFIESKRPKKGIKILSMQYLRSKELIMLFVY